MPFGLTLYVDGMMVCRVSACCEYRHRAGKLLGSKTARFGLVKVEGGRPCYRCLAAEAKEEEEKKEDEGVRRTQQPRVLHSNQEKGPVGRRHAGVGDAPTTKDTQQMVYHLICPWSRI